MSKGLASAFLWIAPCTLFLFNNEIISYFALSVLGVMWIGKMIAAKEAQE